MAVRVILQPPADGQECVQNYNVTDLGSGVGNRSRTTEVLISNLNVCPTEYRFTAVACGGTLPCSPASVPMTHRTASGKCAVVKLQFFVFFH